jgi:hypothetical protein
MSHGIYSIRICPHSCLRLTKAIPSYYDNELSSLITCRNYNEFGRVGKQLDLFSDPIIPLTEESTPRDPGRREYVASTRAIWQEEIEADQYAARIMANLIMLLRERGVPEEHVQHAFSEVVRILRFWH